MNLSTVDIKNSSSLSVYISLRPSSDASIPPSSESHLISPDQTLNIAVSNGTMNMFVWTDIQSPPIWKGIVPTRTRKTLVVNPEERTVRHDSLVIPSGFEPITSLKDPRVSGGKEAFTEGFFSPSNQRNYLLGGIAVFLIIVLIVYFLLFRSKTT